MYAPANPAGSKGTGILRDETPVAHKTGGDIRVERFGHAARRHFLVDFSSWCFLNHGAFGATSRYAFEVANEWRQRCEHQPLRFLDR